MGARGERLVDVLHGDRLDVDDDLAFEGHRIREVLIPRDASDRIHDRSFHSVVPSLFTVRATLSLIEGFEEVDLCRWTPAVVDEAEALLDDDGLDGLSLRTLAGRLGVRLPTLYWHIPSKAALVAAIAKLDVEQEFPDWLPADPDEKLAGLAQRHVLGLRRALLAHRDGARVIALAQLSTNMAAFSDLAMSTLVARDVPLRHARLIVLTAERFTVGFVLDEQTGIPLG